ncbi:unnamed protein product [marine sediment metagenome]|uniref:Uncharacterized protein n=1 Tax=marine sediment metagenome TaxID=412755 RepID=X1RGR5_9ZZZZ
MEQPKQEVCSIRIMFPVESDEQAIDCKKKIAAIISEIPDAHLQFNLSSLPVSPVIPNKTS